MGGRDVEPRGVAGGLFVKIVGVLLAISVIGTWMVANRGTVTMDRAVRAQFQARGEAIAASLALSLAYSPEFDVSEAVASTRVRNFLADTARIEGVLYIYVQTLDGALLLHTAGPPGAADMRHAPRFDGGDLAGKRLPASNKEVAFVVGDTQHRALDIAAPVEEGWLGVVHVGIDLNLIDSLIDKGNSDMLATGWTVAGIGALVGIALVWLVLAMPLRRLIKEVDRVAEGNFAPSTLHPTRDDLGLLVDGFSLMIDRLRTAWEQTQHANEEMRRARDEAERATMVKSLFLANMSHELRTPMNGVIGLTDILSRTELQTDQAEFVEAIQESGRTLLTVIDDILDFSKVEAGKLEITFEDFALCRLVEDVAELVAGRAHDKGVAFVNVLPPDLPARVCGDPVRVRQILINLAGNAVKFTDRGEVVMRTMQGAEGRIRFEVQDTGIGIAPEVQEHLFDAFYQADSSNRRVQGGTGLGLAICWQLTTLMGGDIGLTSTPGRGSTFWVELPLQSRAAAQPARDLTALRGRRVLAVEDNATCRQFLRDLLEGWGMDATLVADAASARELVDQARDSGRPFELAIIDQKMPQINGLALARALRATPEADVGIALLTSALEKVHREQAEASGIAAWVTKPIRASRLLDTMLALTGSRAQSTETNQPPQIDMPVTETQARVLVAEDCRTNQVVARALLTKLGCEVTIVENGRLAVEERFSGHYDVILMDGQMPELSGYEAAAAIRKRENPGEHQIIICITAHAMAGDRERAITAGMDDYLAKPVTLKSLERVLFRWLRRNANRDHRDHRDHRDRAGTTSETSESQPVSAAPDDDNAGPAQQTNMTTALALPAGASGAHVGLAAIAQRAPGPWVRRLEETT